MTPALDPAMSPLQSLVCVYFRAGVWESWLSEHVQPAPLFPWVMGHPSTLGWTLLLSEPRCREEHATDISIGGIKINHFTERPCP